MSSNTNLFDRIPARQDINAIEIFSVDDFPSPISSIIEGTDNTLYQIKSVITIPNDIQFRFGINTRFAGIADSITTIEGNTTGIPLFINTAAAGSSIKGENVGFTQNGSGGLMTLDSDAFDTTIFNRCTLAGGDIRLILGLGFLMYLSDILGGSRLVQGSTGGFSDIRISQNSLLSDGGGTIDGVVLIEAGSSTNTLVVEGAALLLTGTDSIGVKFETGVSFTEFKDLTFLVFNPAATCISVKDPSDIVLGVIDGGSISGTGNVFGCDPDITETVAGIGTATNSVTQDFDSTFTDGNLIVANTAASEIYQYQGLTSTQQGATITTITSPKLVAWFEGDMFVYSGSVITRYVGFSATQVSPAQTVTLTSTLTGFVFIGLALVTLDGADDTVRFYQGFSSTVDASVVLTTFTTPTGLSTDGVNLLIGDASDNSISVMDGKLATVKYSFAPGYANLSDVLMIRDRTNDSTGLVVAQGSTTNSIALTRHPITMDHSAANWSVSNLPTITASSDRGGTQFSAADISNPPTLTIVLDTFIDIAGTDIVYVCFSEYEKMVMNDETNGEIMWLAARDRGRIISTQITISKSAGGGSDDAYGVGISINGVLQQDSVTVIVLRSASEFATTSTLPISRDIKNGDLIKTEIQGVGTSQSLDLILSKLVIT